MNTPYHILIADDEKPARVLLTEYVNKLPQLKLVGCCANAMEAMTLINSQKVDILLTDIQMPDMSGVELVKVLPSDMAVIFTTAYSDYAVQGYDLGVVDYLLKPISFPRFSQAVNKAMQLLALKAKADLADADTAPAEESRDHLLVKADRRLYKINFDEILYIESQREYVTFHTVTRKIMALYSLKKLEEELPAADFIRIHKTYIISKKHIDFLDGNTVSVAGNMLPVGNNYKDEVMRRFVER